MELTFALVVAAASIGSFHTLAPDHWAPFVVLSRAERWSGGRTALITALCGLGHVTMSVALGLLSVVFGLELLQAFGHRLESMAGLFLIGFGVVYGLWGFHRGVRSRWHSHGDAHAHPHWHAHIRGRRHEHQDPREGRVTAWTLFLLFSADPCVAVVPLMFAAAPLGWSSLLAVVIAYELATIATMVSLVLPARATVGAVGGRWADQYGDTLAGAMIATVGLLVVSLGL